MDDPLVSFMYLLLYISVSVIVPYYPAKPKDARDLKLGTYSLLDHQLNLFLFFEKVAPKIKVGVIWSKS